jgi:splicing factor 3B subunit 2
LQQTSQTPASEATVQADPEVLSESDLPAQPVKAPSFEVSEDDPLYAQFKEVLGKFQEPEAEVVAPVDKPEVYYDQDDDIPDEEEEKKSSRKQRKQQSKLSIAELKALVKKPELVEWTDADASDPRLLVAIKSYRNVVPVPSHWSLKREYLSSKRGVEKPPFALPKFILDTGIAEMRDAVLEKQAEQSLKQKQRERVQPKMGKLDVDYQKLYEAFFRFQTKPELTRYGEVYYEGKEYETNLKHLRPGELSDELKASLNIPPGAPPPWLINQQRYGPPPSYPAIKIPGLNAPLPPGADWGYHPGGYGKPPVDEYNRPLYGGDLIGILQPQQNQQAGEPVEKSPWGELQAREEESEEEESDDEDEGDEEEDVGAGLQTPSGMETPGGLTSAVPSEFGGGETVGGEFTLRKQRRGTETEEPAPVRSAYQVVPEKAASAKGFFGSDRVYDLSAAQAQAANQHLPILGQEDNKRKRKVGDVDVSVDVDVLEREDKMSKDEIARQYEAQRQQQSSSNPWARVDQDDLSAMIADESRKRLKKDEERRNRRA